MPRHAFEPELERPVPRPVRHRGGINVVGGHYLFLLLFGLPGMGVLLSALKATLLFLGVLLIGTEVEGRILQKRDSQTKNGPVYSVQYAYTVDGRESSHKVAVSADAYLAAKAGGPVTVRTLPWTAAGHWPRLSRHRPWQEMAWRWWFALFWNGILSLFLWDLYWVPSRQQRLVRWGRPSRGIVRDVRMKTWNSLRSGGVYSEITYEYVVDGDDPLRPQLLTGQAAATVEAGKDIRAGDELTVLYDPQRPKRSLLYKLADYVVQPRSAV